MGRFDDLLTLDKKPAQPPPLPEKTEPVQLTPPPLGDTVSKSTNQQIGLPANLQARKDANLQSGKQISLQTSKDASRQTGKPAKKRTGKLVSLQSGKQVFIEKYSSYLPHEHKKELKRIALESDRNEYEVLLEAVEQYLTRQRKPQWFACKPVSR